MRIQHLFQSSKFHKQYTQAEVEIKQGRMQWLKRYLNSS